MFYLSPNSELLIATQNQGKLKEFKAAFAPYKVNLVSMVEFNLPEPLETGKTFLENALIKARSAADKSGKIVLADDSGLVVPALQGHPGIYSSRWAQDCGGYPQAFQRLEEMLGPSLDRAAYFECTLVLYWLGGDYQTFTERCEGTLTFPARGEKNFGYDPIFCPQGETRTLGEISFAEKQKISHRARALQKLLKACFEKHSL